MTALRLGLNESNVCNIQYTINVCKQDFLLNELYQLFMS